MYDDSRFLDVIEQFKHRYLKTIDTLESSIILLQEDEYYKSSVDLLLEDFLSLKQCAYFLKLSLVEKSLRTIIEVLEILKNKRPPIKQEIVDWFLLISDHINSWAKQIEEHNIDLEPIDNYTLNMVKIATVSITRSDAVLKDLSVVSYIVDHKKRQVYEKLFFENFKKSIFVDALSNMYEYVNLEKPNIAIINSTLNDERFVTFAKSIKLKNPDTLFFIISTKKPNKAIIKSLMMLGFTHIFSDQEVVKDLLLNIKHSSRAFFEKKWVISDDKDIKDFISDIRPLPEIVIKAQQISNDQNKTTRDLSNLLSEDPLLTAKILKSVNSPIFSLRNDITTVQNAVSLLGKEKISALIMQQSVSELVSFPDLSPYGILKDDFYDISKRRMELMVAWYSKVSFNSLSVLASSALLGNLGQLVIAHKINSLGISKDFFEVAQHTSSIVAEAEFLNTTSVDISADILSHWGMNATLIDSIRYSCDIANAPDHIKEYAIANYAVYTTISSFSKHKYIDDIVTEVSELLQEMNMDYKKYRLAVEKVLKR